MKQKPDHRDWKKWLSDNQMSQADLALAIGVTRKTVWSAVHGRPISRKTQRKFFLFRMRLRKRGLDRGWKGLDIDSKEKRGLGKE
jgi:hypothetical protein